jgi:uncharacterized damage-inducible protein DinB
MLPEVEQYLRTLADLRSQVGGMIRAVPADGLNWRPSLPAGADPTNSLAVLAVHVAGAEHFWIAENIGGYPHTRIRDQEFTYVAKSSQEPLERLSKVGEETHAILEKLSAEQLEGSFMKDDMAVPIRWAIHHVIFHSSLHIGHMQLTYQLWNQGKATTSPRWFDRLPKK